MNGKPSVLIIENDATLQESLKLILDEVGYTTIVAGGLEDALPLIDQQTFHFVLTEVLDPSPKEAIPQTSLLCQRVHPTPVGLLTAWRLAPEMAERKRFAFILEKPFDLDHLLAQIAAAMAQPLTAEDERHAECISALFHAISQRDWDALTALCTEDVDYILPTPIYGRDAYITYVREGVERFPEARYDDVLIFPLPNGLATRYVLSWRATDGTTSLFRGGAAFQFRDDLISQIGVQSTLDISKQLSITSRHKQHHDEKIADC